MQTDFCKNTRDFLSPLVQILQQSIRQSPESRRVIRHVSLGMYSLRRDPLATNSTNASVFPARWRNGRNCLAFDTSYTHTQTPQVHGRLTSCKYPKETLNQSNSKASETHKESICPFPKSRACSCF